MRWWAALAIIAACQGSSRPSIERKQATGSDRQATGADPWGGPPPGGAPSLAERHALVDKACPVVTNPHFYRVEKAGRVAYLLGTRHISIPLSKLPQVVRDQVAASQLGVFEIAPDDDARPRSKVISLPDALGSADWAHYRELLDDSDPPTSASPSSALLGLAAMYEDPSAMLEGDLERELGVRDVPMRGLETAAFQDALLDKLLDLRMLRAAVEQTKDRSELAEESHDDLVSYCTGTDHDPGMDAKLKKQLVAAGYTAGEIDRIDDELVYARNRDWIPKLDTIFQTDHVFVAVGVDHLIGPRGVVALLTARGYHVTRVVR